MAEQLDITAFDLVGLRKRLGFNQADMAKQMGMGARAYFTLEQDRVAINKRHVMIAQLVSLKIAVERKDVQLAEPAIAAMARKFCRLGRD